MDRFVASVQYNDFFGTCAADAADDIDLHKFLLERGMMSKDQLLVAVEAWVGENHGGECKSAFVHAYTIDVGEFDKAAPILEKDPIPVGRISLEMSVEDFVALFKRFSISISKHGLNIDGRGYELIDDRRF